MDNILPSVKILGTSITNASKKDILEFVVKKLKKKDKKFYIVTPNPEILVYATRSTSFQRILNNATVSLADGVGVTLSGSILKKQVKERITGVDFMLDLCQRSAKEGFTIGLLGGEEGVAEKAAKCLLKKYPHLRVIYTDSEDRLPRIKNLRKSVPNLRESVAHVDILFVAMGAPKQEEWIAENLPVIDVSVAMGVGGAFDYISGKVPRAPEIVRRLGLEWAFRLALQPWRIKRQLSLPVFMLKVLKEKWQG